MRKPHAVQAWTNLPMLPYTNPATLNCCISIPPLGKLPNSLRRRRHRCGPLMCAAVCSASFRCILRATLSHAPSSSCHRSSPLFSPLSPFFRPLRTPSLRFVSLRAYETAFKPLQREAEAEDGAEELVRRTADHHYCEAASEREMRRLSSPDLEVMELEELPDQWKRSRIAWLCKELPSHKPATLIRILNAQRKWISQEDATYIAVHCMRIREHEAALRVYKWMQQQHWFSFDFGLATKLADSLGRERKFAKCRDVFDSIINQGRVPSESTFHILTVAYLSSPIAGCLDEACSVYNRMIQLGGYNPRLSLHNSLFQALVSNSGILSKKYLKQAEFIYHNLLTTWLEIRKEVYVGLIWLHSYQDVVDRERIASLREEMEKAGFEESKDVLVSLMRGFSKEGDVGETEIAWCKILELGATLPSQAFVYRMEAYAKAGQPSKSLEIFNSMKEQGIPRKASAYQKIIEIMAKAEETKISGELLIEFTKSGLKNCLTSFLDVMNMYSRLGMHEEVEKLFSKCIVSFSPNRSIYTIYLGSLVRSNNFQKAKEIFNEMHANGAIGSDEQSSNIILGGLLDHEDFVEAEKIFDIMCQKKYGIEDCYMEKIQYFLSLKRKELKRPISMKLDVEQREILMGLLLGGVRILSDDARKTHLIRFEFNETSSIHSLLRMHIHERFYEWLTPLSRSTDEQRRIPFGFSTISHSYFSFFADQFCPKGRPVVPRLVHRWLSPRVLAYWYMYGGLRTASGDILLKLKGASGDDMERVSRAFSAKSLACKLKRKGSVLWIGFQGNNANWYWKLIEPNILDGMKDLLEPNGDSEAESFVVFDMDSDSQDEVM